DSYSASLDVRLPDGIGGDFDILVFTDSNIQGPIDGPKVGGDGSGDMGRVEEFQGEGNNITASFMPGILTPPPDLVVSSVAAAGPDPAEPGHVLTGQLFTVTYTVSNDGPGDTPDRHGSWDDYIYLSRDPFLSDADTYFTFVEHDNGLKAGRSYTNTVSLKAP